MRWILGTFLVVQVLWISVAAWSRVEPILRLSPPPISGRLQDPHGSVHAAVRAYAEPHLGGTLCGLGTPEARNMLLHIRALPVFPAKP